MRYTETKFQKFIGSRGFYTTVAICIIAIGAASWFAVSRYKSADVDKKENNIKEYSSSAPSYTSSEKTASEEMAVDKNVSNETYSGEESSAAPQPAAEYFTIPINGNVTKSYNDKELQYSATFGDLRIHTGIDIAAEEGDEVFACGVGTVTDVIDSATLGGTVIIDHGNDIVIKYCGLKDITVKNGDVISENTLIGNVSVIPNESADQSHIHIETYKNDECVSPYTVLGIAQ